MTQSPSLFHADARIAAMRRGRARAFAAAAVALAFCAAQACAQAKVTPERLDGAVAALDHLVAEAMASTGVPGIAVAVAHGGKTIFAKGYGLREVGKPEAVDADTVFQIASVSKAVAATVVAHQVHEGVVDWSTPVKSVLPWFALSDPWVSAHVTIGDLFSHRSGLPDHAGDDLEDIGYDRAQILRRLAYLPLDPFRLSHNYTNAGLTAAAEAVAVASGTDWAGLSEDVLYKPLGMSHTSSRFADFIARPDRAVGHMLVNGAYQPYQIRQPDPQAPAGGVSSTVTDLAHWMTLILEEGSESAAMLPALTVQSVSRPAASAQQLPGFYGFGFNIGLRPTGHVSLSHSGAFALGAATTFMMVPADDLGIVVLTNAAPIGVPEAIGAQFMDLAETGALQRDDWPSFIGGFFAHFADPVGTLAGVAPPDPPRAPAPFAAYAGLYQNGYVGDVRVEATASGLVLYIGPKPEAFTLTPWDGDTFTYATITENKPIGSVSSVTFAPPVNGKAPSLSLDPFSPADLGILMRKD